MTGREEYIDPKAVLLECVSAIREAQSEIKQALRELRTQPELAKDHFDKLIRISGNDARKALLHIDAAAETRCKSRLLKAFPKNVQVIGEESLGGFSSWGSERVCVLSDMVDGTDLMEMGIGLWCSAIVIYDHQQKKILGSAVGLASGEIYYADVETNDAFVEFEGNNYRTYGCSAVETLREARVMYYGQKAKNSVGTNENHGYAALLRKFRDDLDVPFRVFNFAGNSMMAKLCDSAKTPGGVAVAAGVDAVFEICGQRVHDVLPGAFIAKKRGAYFCDLQGQEYSYLDLGRMMENPHARIKYILASTRALAVELAATFRSDNRVQENIIAPPRKRASYRSQATQLRFEQM